MRRRRKILIALTGAVCTVIVLAVVRHYQLRSETRAYNAQLKAEGEPMDLASILPPPVPPEKNGADVLRQASALIDTNTSLLKTNFDIPAMNMVAPGKAMIGWQQADIREETATDSWQEIAAAVAQNQDIFALLHQVISKPDFDFQIQYNRGVDSLDFMKIGLAASREAAQWSSAATVYHLHAGDTASAVDNVRAILAVTQALKDERFVISELVRIAIAQIAVRATWEILQSPAVTDEQLAQLQNDWANLDFIQSGENALAMERVTGRISLATWRASSSQFATDIIKDQNAAVTAGLAGGEESLWARASMKPKIFMWKNWWSYPDELRSLKGYEILLNSLRMAQTNGSLASAIDYQDNELEKLRLPVDDVSLFSADTDFHSMLSQSISVLRVFIRHMMPAEVARQTVTTAIALKRYQLKHGNYPPNLDGLVPEFLSAIPPDPVDGKPLRYHPNRDGTFLLYSVGFNGKDDGGNPTVEKGVEEGNMYWLNNHALDWVWPQPATDAEIRNYWAHPPK
jgi:hypothetical protein